MRDYNIFKYFFERPTKGRNMKQVSVRSQDCYLLWSPNSHPLNQIPKFAIHTKQHFLWAKAHTHNITNQWRKSYKKRTTCNYLSFSLNPILTILGTLRFFFLILLEKKENSRLKSQQKMYEEHIIKLIYVKACEIIYCKKRLWGFNKGL